MKSKAYIQSNPIRCLSKPRAHRRAKNRRVIMSYGIVMLVSSNISSITHPPPPSHTDTTCSRLPQEAFPSHQLSPLPQFELKSSPNRSRDKRQFHLRDIPPYARSWSIRKRNERSLLLLGQVYWVPAVGVEEVGIEGGIVGGVPDGG